MESDKEDNRLVLVCVDGSNNSLKALNWYHTMMYRESDTIGIVHIHSLPPHTGVGFLGGGVAGYSMHRTALLKSLKESKEIVNRFQNICDEKNMKSKVFLETMKHSVGETICDVARKNNAAQIVTGKRGVGLIHRALLGSVSEYILHNSNVPITVVEPAGEDV